MYHNIGGVTSVAAGAAGTALTVSDSLHFALAAFVLIMALCALITMARRRRVAQEP